MTLFVLRLCSQGCGLAEAQAGGRRLGCLGASCGFLVISCKPECSDLFPVQKVQSQE